MSLDKSALSKKITRTPPNQILALTVDQLDKNSVKTTVAALTKFLTRTDASYTVIAIRN